MIKAVIFDMDGLLIDTEPFWQESERRIFGELGIHMTPEMQVETFGLRTDEQIRYWYGRKPWKSPTIRDVEEKFTQTMLDYYVNHAKLLPGAKSALDFFKKKGLPIALSSSSNMRLISAFLDKFAFHHYFKVVYSAEAETYGKPHPAVYLETAKRLNTDSVNCLALEDSFHGMIAAKAARMKTIVVPEKKEDRFKAADMVLDSLTELNEKVLENLEKY